MKWISCKKRLPKKPTGPAYYPFKGNDISADEYIVMIRGAEVPTSLYWSGEVWFSPYGIDGGYTYNVIAWMPFPEPYREEANT